MIKTRLIPCVITKGDLVVQSFNFNKFLPIGDIKTAIEFFANWDVDEIIVIDIDASKEKRDPNFDLVSWASKECFVPLTVGGGIKSQRHIDKLLKAGADKVCLNSVARENIEFITESSNTFGNQCITVSIDIKMVNGKYFIYDYTKKEIVDSDVRLHLQNIESAGAGEILINSVDRDGSRQGYDIELLKQASSSVTIPVIALGGVGRFEHLSEAITNGGCHAAAAANIFQHVEHSTIAAKSQMRAAGINVRLSSDVKYEDFSLDILGRPF
ncbi:imidazole glycerol phosphate synthase cyclase subunit [Oceanospirillum sanctuarii]|uniref:imidazole glycerol phosphate synthase cyclase subunit n=1 Tax=Oceanospirillum sanctuarii TaxID=1434821 RepID=UPI000A3C7E3B|nr:imidazole glycerol phosphate synthase cyclase subunit [Oceanospirillum sanctuarii]